MFWKIYKTEIRPPSPEERRLLKDKEKQLYERDFYTFVQLVLTEDQRKWPRMGAEKGDKQRKTRGRKGRTGKKESGKKLDEKERSQNKETCRK